MILNTIFIYNFINYKINMNLHFIYISICSDVSCFDVGASSVERELVCSLQLQSSKSSSIKKQTKEGERGREEGIKERREV